MSKKIIICTALLMIIVIAVLVLPKLLRKNERVGGSETVFCSFNSSINENGRLYLGDHNIRFTDFNSMEDIVLCSKPNCLHERETSENPEPDCYAVYSGGVVSALGIYEGYLYVILDRLDVANKAVVYRSDLDGSNRIKITEMDSSTRHINAIFTGGKIYTEGIIYEMEEDGYTNTGRSRSYILCIDINERTWSVITPEKEGYSSGILLLGMYENKLYYRHNYMDQRFNIDDPSANIFYDHVYEYDISTGQETLLEFADQLYDMKVYGSSLYYIEIEEHSGLKNIYRFHIDTGEQELLLSSLDIHSFKFLDNKMFYILGEYDGGYVQYTNTRGFYYDIDTGETSELPYGSEETAKIVLDAETSDRFIVTFLEYVDGVGGGNNISGWIYKEDYYNGSLNFHLIAE